MADKLAKATAALGQVNQAAAGAAEGVYAGTKSPPEVSPPSPPAPAERK